MLNYSNFQDSLLGYNVHFQLVKHLRELPHQFRGFSQSLRHQDLAKGTKIDDDLELVFGKSFPAQQSTLFS